MTTIKKITDKQGNDIYLRTHTKAVVDDNGYTAESRLAAMQDEINSAQLEIGAVESDLTPTENSSNWVTSGGVYNAIQEVQTGLTELEESLHTQETIDLSSLTLKNFYVNGSNVWVSSTGTCGKFLPVNGGDVYTLTSQSADSVVISIVKSMSQIAGSAPDFSASFPSRIVRAKAYTVTIPSDAHYIWIRTKYNGTDITPTIVRKTEKFALLTDVNNLTENVEALTYPCRVPIDYLAGTSTLQFWIGTSGNWNIKSNAYPYYCRIATVKPNTRYRITAKSTRGVNYALLSNNTPVEGQQATDWNGGKHKIISVNGYEEVNTEGYEYLYLRWDATYFDYPKTVEECVGVQEALDSLNSETVLRKKLDMEFGFIANSGSYLGYNSPMSNENYDWLYWRNTGMVRVKSGSNYTIDTDVAATYIRFYWYDEDRLYIDNTQVSSPSQGTDGLYHATANALGKFMRVVIYYNSQYSPEVYVNGELDANCWHTYLGSYIPYGSVMNFVTDTYYQTLNSDIAETATVQDTGYKLINRGLLKLPTNYDPDGEPSRLVIYCHGADGFQNWSNSTTSFDVDHINPTLWINSGYAVMDMDDLTRTTYLNGVEYPTNLTQNLYERGYEFAIKNYNIRTDGVILCGRSMGGQRCMQLLSSKLPILCCCLIAPSCCFTRYWNMGGEREAAALYNNFPTTIDIDGVETEINWGSTNAISDIEWAAMQKYFRMVMNSNGILKLLSGVNKSDFFKTHVIDGNEVSLRSNPITWDKEVFSNWAAKIDIPIKIWFAKDDTYMKGTGYDVGERDGLLLYNIVNNGGGICELHVFATGGHYPERDGAKVTYTNKYGITYENTSLVYAEMLQFIRRYEQDN